MRHFTFITHESALELHRYAMLLGRGMPTASIAGAPRHCPRNDGLRELEDLIESELGGLRLSRPLHLSMVRASDAPKLEHLDIKVHSARKRLPRDSAFRFADRVLCASPPLAFIQAASKRSIAQSALLAMEYCGTYSTKLGDHVQYDLRQTLRKEELLTGISQFSGMHGLRTAQFALRFAQENSASPRESQFLLALCMPASLGGAGVPLPKMNYEIECSDQAQRISGRNMLRCDLCWPEAKLDVEYQSREFHEGTHRRVRDSRRANALQAMGFTVIQVTNSELNTMADFNVIAGTIKERLGIRNRIRVKDYEGKQMSLRRDLGLPVIYG